MSMCIMPRQTACMGSTYQRVGTLVHAQRAQQHIHHQAVVAVSCKRRHHTGNLQEDGQCKCTLLQSCQRLPRTAPHPCHTAPHAADKLGTVTF